MSDKSIVERLQVKGGRRLAVLGASTALDSLIGADGLRASAREAEVLLLFTPDRAVLDRALPTLLEQARRDAILWVAYPKMTSPQARDLHRDVIRGLAPAFGLDTVSQIAIDEDWSALRLKRID